MLLIEVVVTVIVIVGMAGLLLYTWGLHLENDVLRQGLSEAHKSTMDAHHQFALQLTEVNKSYARIFRDNETYMDNQRRLLEDGLDDTIAMLLAEMMVLRRGSVRVD